MEIPASQGGVVKEVKVKLGDKVKQGSLVLLLEAEGAVDSPQTSEQKPAAAPRGCTRERYIDNSNFGHRASGGSRQLCRRG